MNDYRNIWMTAILIFSDSFWYGFIYEKMHWLKDSIFYEVNFKGSTYVPVYRLLIQWPLDGLVLYNVWKQGYAPLAGMLIAWYLLIKEGGYYTVLFQWKNLKADEILGTDLYWLKRIYFIGYFLFKDKFTVKRFAISCIIGLIILVFSNFI